MAETTEDKIEAGDKKRAGRLVSTFLRSVAQEKIAVEVTEGESKLITRAEALARQLWKMALGKFVKHVDMKTGTIYYEAPDKHAMDIVIDRMEGRVGTLEDEQNKDETIPDKISRKNKQKISKIALTSESSLTSKDGEQCPKDSS